MDPEDFKRLRALPGKVISADIEFVSVKKIKDFILFFDDALVENSLGKPVFVSGQYHRKTTRFTLTFTLQGCGQICRVCVRGCEHRGAGRTHKHDVRKPDDVKNHLPDPRPRPDWAEMTPKEIWDIVCRDAHIEHTGRFIDPSEC